MNSEHRALCNEFLSLIASEDLKAVFNTIIAHSNSLAEYTCFPHMNGVVPLFRYERKLDGVIPYDFIINRKRGFLFYFRPHGLSNKAANVERLSGEFSEVKIVKDGVIWVRVNNTMDTSKLLKLVFEKPPQKGNRKNATI